MKSLYFSQSNLTAEQIYSKQFEPRDQGAGVRALERNARLKLQDRMLETRAKAGRVKELLDEFIAGVDKAIRDSHNQAEETYNQAEREMAGIEDDIWNHNQKYPRDIAWMEKNEALIRRRGFAAQALETAGDALISADEAMRTAVHRAIASRVSEIDAAQRALYARYLEDRQTLGKDRTHLQMVSQQITRNLFERGED